MTKMNRRQRRLMAAMTRQGKTADDLIRAAVPKQGPVEPNGLPGKIHHARGLRYPAKLLKTREVKA
ncbi:hypothetical protein OEZ49_07295 [Ruegeria sp. WL0004]|uniref:Uncharacterized protein n=1 Tax=Ruegeria marisflavi TaxID=2984152 RepID=A0ABT2WU66_9RHOB|nr:hypothetical protein [Ruegeria sp. WL0004]MCU9837568.1 hypothetical protein [Ruegeria sp. WL0004]